MKILLIKDKIFARKGVNTIVLISCKRLSMISVVLKINFKICASSLFQGNPHREDNNFL